MFDCEQNRPSHSSFSYMTYFAESTSSDDDEIGNAGRDGDPAMVDKDYLVKKYIAMQRKYHALEVEHDRLVVAHQTLKANSLREYALTARSFQPFILFIAMPCDVGRKWLSSISRLVNPKQSQSNTDFIASELGIKKSSLLTSCIRDTASNTTRQVIKLLFSPAELENGRGADVSDQQRKLIRGIGALCKRRMLQANLSLRLFVTSCDDALKEKRSYFSHSLA